MGILCVCAIFNYSVCIFRPKEWREIVGFFLITVNLPDWLLRKLKPKLPIHEGF